MLCALKNRISEINSLKKLTLLLCIALVLMSGIGSSFSYMVTGTPTLLNRFINGMNSDGDLVIQKIVSHPFGEGYAIPDGLAFAYTVDLGDEYAGETLKTTQGEMTADENGVLTVTVIPGGRTTIYDVDEETTVTVTETLIGTGFTPDAVSKDLTIQKYQDNILTFTNTYTPAMADTSALAVSGSKTLAGREWMEGDFFTFAFEVWENGEWKSLGVQTVAYELVEQPDPLDPQKIIMAPKTDFDKFDFTELIRSYHFANAGSYSFRVTEIEGSIGGVTYDESESKFDVLVGDADMDGYLEIQSITTTSANTVVDGTAVSIGFENSYAPAGSAESVIKLRKLMEDTSGQNKSTAGYTFELYDTARNLILTSDPTGTTGETSIRLIYEPTDAGKTFEYVLKESGCGDTVGALTYDATTYSLKVTVVDNLDGTVSAYIYDSDVVWDSAVSDGNDESAGNNESDENSTVSGGDAGSAANDLNTVSGGDAGANGISESGTLARKVIVPDGLTNTCQKTFVNRYDPVDASVVISGKKTLSGREMNPGEFAFQLYRTDADFVIPDGAQPILTAVNGADERFSFDALEFDQVGTDYYVVKEDSSAALGGVTYDDSSYLVKVVVTDTDGVLHAAVSAADRYGNDSEILFRNSYRAAPVYLLLGGRKTVNGIAPQDWTFHFQLFTADEAYNAQGESVQTVTSSAAGEFSFETLTFRGAGIYRYVVTEQSGTVEGMTYDGSKYCIYVQVTDPGDGQLAISEFSITKDGNVVSEIVFANTYVEPDEPGEPNIPDEPDKLDKPDDPDRPDEPDEPDDSIVPVEPTEPDETTSTEQTDQPIPPKTGDDSNMMLYSILMIVSGCMLLILLVIGRGKKR